MRDVPLSLLGRLLDAIVPAAIRRWLRQRRAVRQIEQIRQEVDQCALFYVADTQHGASERGRQLPTESMPLILSLHADGFLAESAMNLLREFFAPAQDANALLVAPSLGGPPMMNLALRAGCLVRGKGFVQIRDGNGITLHERVKAELAETISNITRRV